LIDRLPPTQLAASAGLLEAMLELGEEEERAVGEATRWVQINGGKGIPHESVPTDFGLTMDEFERLGERRAERRRS
jgi:hypothetical protein